MNQQVPTPSVGGIRCPWCGSPNVHVQAVSEVKQRGCFTVLLYLILLCIPVVGWIALFFSSAWAQIPNVKLRRMPKLRAKLET